MTAAQDLFWLVHYAYNTLNPLVDEAKAIEPSTVLYLDMGFGNEQSAHHKFHRVGASVHWGREGLLAMSYPLKHRTDVDLFAESLRAKIDKLQPAPEVERREPLEVGIPA